MTIISTRSRPTSWSKWRSTTWISTSSSARMMTRAPSRMRAQLLWPQLQARVHPTRPPALGKLYVVSSFSINLTNSFQPRHPTFSSLDIRHLEHSGTYPSSNYLLQSPIVHINLQLIIPISASFQLQIQISSLPKPISDQFYQSHQQLTYQAIQWFKAPILQPTYLVNLNQSQVNFNQSQWNLINFFSEIFCLI